MIFRYKKYASEILRPVIPIEIVYKDKLVSYEVLVDSGSDCNIFDAQIADILGLDLHSGKKSEIAGITGNPEPVYIHKLDLRIGGHLSTGVGIGLMFMLVLMPRFQQTADNDGAKGGGGDGGAQQ